MTISRKLAVVASHPTQYYAPWFAHLTANLGWNVRIYYLWDFGITEQTDPRFGLPVKWDINLTLGYEYEIVPNLATHPGTEQFSGLHNPTLRSRLRGWNPDVVLVFGYGWRTLASLAFRWRGAPLILRGDTHRLGRPKRKSWKTKIRGLFLKILFRQYAAFACVGEANQNFYAANGVVSSRLFKVPHCIDNQRFGYATTDEISSWRQRNGLGENEFLFLFAGKFESKKRPELLVQAFRKIDLPNVRLVLIGDGALLSTLNDLTDSDERIKLLPFHNQSEMPAALGAADIVVLPSQGPEESWGLIVNESMAAGTPAVVSDHVGCAPDLVTEGETGWVFPAGDGDALQKCLIKAKEQLSSDRKGFGQRISERINKYDYSTATNRLAAMLANVYVKSQK